MRNKAVLDTSFIASLFFRDRFTKWSREIIKQFHHLLTIDYAYIELYNIAWKRISLFGEDKDIGLKALNYAIRFLETLEIEDFNKYLDDALKLGLKLGIPVYDSLFLSLALKRNALFITTDLKLVRKISKNEEIRRLILNPT